MTYHANKRPRNWTMTIIAAIVAAANSVLFLITLFNLDALGSWSILLLLGSMTGAGLAITAIATNDQSWLLIDLISSYF